MRKFCDLKGKEYSISLTVGSFRDFKDLIDVDLLSMSDAELAKTFEDIVTVIDLIYVSVKDQCDDAGISDRDFGYRLEGDSLDAAVEAFARAYADFSPPSKRKALHKFMDATKSVRDRAFAAMAEKAKELQSKSLEEIGEIFSSQQESVD